MRSLICFSFFFFWAFLSNLNGKCQSFQDESGRKDFKAWVGKPPVETLKAIGQNIIRNTAFQYKLQFEKPAEKFDFIKAIDFGRTFGNHGNSVAFALSDIQSAIDTTISLEISHNDGIRVWVNDQMVYNHTGDRPFFCEARERDIRLMAQFPVKLKKGSNKILIKSETRNKRWLVFLQPAQATIEFSIVKGLSLGLSGINGIDKSVAELSNWLVCGPFETKPMGLEDQYGPEEGMVIGKTYPNRTGETSWTIPKTEIFTNVLNPHPLWGTLYNYNYHTAGLAWSMANLGKQTGIKAFTDYAFRYCDFMLDARKMVDYQYNQLHGFRSVQHHLIHTPLLDFTAAPTLPYAALLASHKNFQRREQYKARVEEIKSYLKNEQVRLPDGTFTRETPEKYTTWVDDMFMGIPFLVHAGLAAETEKEKSDYLNQAAQQVLGFNRQVFDRKDNLYHHAVYSSRKANIPYWSRANGWGVFATSIVLQYLPENHPSYRTILNDYKAHCKRLVGLQDKKSGFWHQVLNDTSSYLETSGTAIFTMAMARGLNRGWLKGKEYENAAREGWKAISTQISPEGDVYNICIGTMSSEDPGYYKTRPLVKSDSHGLIGVFWAAMEWQTWIEKSGSGKK